MYNKYSRLTEIHRQQSLGGSAPRWRRDWQPEVAGLGQRRKLGRRLTLLGWWLTLAGMGRTCTGIGGNASLGIPPLRPTADDGAAWQAAGDGAVLRACKQSGGREEGAGGGPGEELRQRHNNVTAATRNRGAASCDIAAATCFCRAFGMTHAMRTRWPCDLSRSAARCHGVCTRARMGDGAWPAEPAACHGRSLGTVHGREKRRRAHGGPQFTAKVSRSTVRRGITRTPRGRRGRSARTMRGARRRRRVPPFLIPLKHFRNCITFENVN
jgi:hypothetical protein